MSRMSTTHTLTTTSGGLTAGDLVQFAQTFPPETEVSVSVSEGDRPWESGSVTIRATVTEESQR